MRCSICDYNPDGLSNLNTKRGKRTFHNTSEGYICSECKDSIASAVFELLEENEEEWNSERPWDRLNRETFKKS